MLGILNFCFLFCLDRSPRSIPDFVISFDFFLYYFICGLLYEGDVEIGPE
eukprot:UN33772